MRERLLDVGMTMTEASICGLGHTAGIAVMSAIEKFPELFAPHPPGPFPHIGRDGERHSDRRGNENMSEDM